MWSFDRRTVILGALALGGCGFEPVYAPGGAGEKLLGQVSVSAPASSDGYHFTTRFEERLGRGTSAPYKLSVTLSASNIALGNTSLGDTTRYRVNGVATYTLADTSGAAVTSGTTEAFTGFNTIGSTVATLAAERDARKRLMVLLADQVIDAVILEFVDGP